MLPPETDGQIGTGTASFPALAASASMGPSEFSDTPADWPPLQVTYAGSTTWLVSGTIQVNVQLPE